MAQMLCSHYVDEPEGEILVPVGEAPHPDLLHLFESAFVGVLEV